jgi:hypothetical protein
MKEIDISLEGPLFLCTSDQSLFVSTKTYQFLDASIETGNQTTIYFLKYDWDTIFNQRLYPLAYYLPGQVIRDMRCEMGKLIISMMEKKILIYDTQTMRKLYLIEMEMGVEIGLFLNEYLIFTSFNQIKTQKLAKSNHVCDECINHFDDPSMSSGNSILTICLCKHYMK